MANVDPKTEGGTQTPTTTGTDLKQILSGDLGDGVLPAEYATRSSSRPLSPLPSSSWLAPCP